MYPAAARVVITLLGLASICHATPVNQPTGTVTLYSPSGLPLETFNTTGEHLAQASKPVIPDIVSTFLGEIRNAIPGGPKCDPGSYEKLLRTFVEWQASANGEPIVYFKA